MSLVLYGENGTGKSTLVDAVDFCLRGRLSRRTGVDRKRRREVLSFLGEKGPAAVVCLSDGKCYARGNLRHTEGTPELLKALRPHPAFAAGPIAIRRQDILSFWDLEDEERMAYFFDFQVEDDRNLLGFRGPGGALAGIDPPSTSGFHGSSPGARAGDRRRRT